MTHDVEERVRTVLRGDSRGPVAEPITGWAEVVARLERRRRPRVAATVTVLATLLAVAVAVAVRRDDPAPAPVTPAPTSSVSRAARATLDDRLVPFATIPAGAPRPGVTADSIFVPDWEGGRVVVLDAGTGAQEDSVAVGDPRNGPLGVTASFGVPWVLNFGAQQVWRLEGSDAAVRVPVNFGSEGALAAAGEDLWVNCCATAAKSTVLRLDARTGAVRARIPLDGLGLTLAAGEDVVVVRGAPGEGSLDRVWWIDTSTNKVAGHAEIAGVYPRHLVVTEHGVWTHDGQSLTRLAPSAGETGRVELSGLEEDDSIVGLATDGRFVWASVVYRRIAGRRVQRSELVTVDAMTGALVNRVEVPAAGELAYGEAGLFLVGGETLYRFESGLCSRYEQAQRDRAADVTDVDVIHALVEVLPPEHRDDGALWYYPYGGPVGPDADGVAATAAGLALERMYAERCR